MTKRFHKKEAQNTETEFDKNKLEKIQKMRKERKSILRRNQTMDTFKIQLNNKPYIKSICKPDPMNKTFSFQRESQFANNFLNQKKKEQILQG